MTDKAIKQVPWTRMIVEGVVIVSSILLAFSIDALWEERNERQQEQAVLVNLQAEFAEGLQLFDSFIIQMDDRESFAISLLKVARDPGTRLPDNIATMLTQVFLNQRTLNAPTGALDSYLASGNSELIQNLRLRTLLASWSSLLDENTEEEIGTDKLIDEELRPFLMSRIELGPIYAAHPIRMYGDFPDQELDTIAVREVLADPDFVNFVTIRLSKDRVTQRELRALQTSASEVLNLLGQEIK